MASPNTILRARFGDFVVDFESFELRKRGVRLKLQDQPFQILKLLLQRQGQLVTREELCATLWEESTFVDFDTGLNAAVRRLRDVLIDSADQPRYIETLPRHGYRFIAPVEVLAEAPAVGVKNSVTTLEEMTPDESAHSVGAPAEVLVKQTNSWLRAIVPTCVLVLTLGVGAFTLRSKMLARHPSDIRIHSIAVLPLQNLSGDPSQDFFADGMTDILITNLAGLNSVRVISRTSAMHYKGSPKSLPEIARELDVDAVVEGTVSRAGDRVRINARLIDAESDRHLWAHEYNSDLKNILQIQSDLAATISKEVAGKLTLNGQPHVVIKPRQVDPEAYDAYLEGEYFLDRWTGQGFDRAKSYFEHAIRLDPSFVDATRPELRRCTHASWIGLCSEATI